MNPETSAKYGQPACPNAPNACYCTGKCTINEVYGVDMQHRVLPKTEPINAAHAAKIKEIMERTMPINVTDSTVRFRKQQIAAMPSTLPSFVEDHNAEEDADAQHQLIQDTLSEVADQVALAGAVSVQFAPLKEVLTGLEDILRYKNLKYGNSALHGVGVLSKASVLEKLLARADDKIARIKNSDVLRKGDCGDLIGYLVLICAHQGWNNFDDQKD